MSEVALSNPPGIPQRPLTRPHRQRFPAGNGPGALPGFRHVGHAGKQPAQLDGSRQFTSLAVRIAAASASVTANMPAA